MSRRDEADYVCGAVDFPRTCGATTRMGTPCRLPPVTGKTRCRMHGGATGSGAQPGNQNARTHGYYTAAARAERKRLADQLRWIRKEMKALVELEP
jgi:hypothetical protein